MGKPRILLVIGTRPEAIKLAPVVRECRRESDRIEPVICFTGQHREMLRQVADYFGIEPDVNLDLMSAGHSLAQFTARCLAALDHLIETTEPAWLVAQGDTTTVMVAAIAAFYRGVPFAHVEAGLRTGDLHSPWPEEFNRRLVSLAAELHFAPTRRAAENLLAEGVPAANIKITGNTVVDALLETIGRERIRDAAWRERHQAFGTRPLVLITGHRRESFGEGLANICRAVATLAARFPDVEFVYPVHLNPQVQRPVYALLGGQRNIHLLAPVSYPEFVWLMDRSSLILTDSGGIQEEAPSLGKLVLVMREATERMEAVESGTARLVGTSAERIAEQVSSFLSEPAPHPQCEGRANPYGDGHAAERIVQNLLDKMQNEQDNERTHRLDRHPGTHVDHCRMPASEPAGAIEHGN